MRTKLRLGPGSDPLAALQALERELNRLWSPPVAYDDDVTITENMFSVLLDGTDNTVDATLPDAPGMQLWVFCKNASFAVTLVGTVNEVANYSMSTGEGLILQCDESFYWWIFGQYL